MKKNSNPLPTTLEGRIKISYTIEDGLKVLYADEAPEIIAGYENEEDLDA